MKLVRISDNTHRQLKIKAAELGCTLNETIHHLLDLENNNETISFDENKPNEQPDDYISQFIAENKLL